MTNEVNLIDKLLASRGGVGFEPSRYGCRAQVREVENNKSEDGKEDENNMTTPSAFETAETPTTTKKSAAKNNVASTPKSRAISNKTKAAIAAIEDITSSPSPKRKYLLVGTSQCARFTPAEPPSNSGASCHLLNSGHSVVWNRIAIKCHKFQEAGAKFAETPSDVIKMTDVTLACLSDPQVAKDLVFGTCGVMSVKLVGKVYIQGSKNQAEEGMLITLAARERGCQTCLEAITRSSFYLGDVSNASKINLVLQMIDDVTLWPASDLRLAAKQSGALQLENLKYKVLLSAADENLEKLSSNSSGKSRRGMRCGKVKESASAAKDTLNQLGSIPWKINSEVMALFIRAACPCWTFSALLVANRRNRSAQ
ncbi:3-hydroxyisobutyrate dehydrogenase [Culex quinquefasciatus]|uniref:3-hydroxyisobutyrate dehydrogenase n=1 Tax=Culex quinquefasciatus TaxID=7176 RepID=B0XBC9_CULQU|nr:3-hydroxyisobutyrate dehydrogenase [Culex quinquefasciatus]|eukprot:XP_001866951.1 3-hydroxyisobutyrate dehydrogenase [Culex quinquefasciatus]